LGRASDRDCTVGSANPPLDSETLAALTATARQHRLTILASHANQKPVCPLAAAIIRLERALHL